MGKASGKQLSSEQVVPTMRHPERYVYLKERLTPWNFIVSMTGLDSLLSFGGSFADRYWTLLLRLRK